MRIQAIFIKPWLLLSGQYKIFFFLTVHFSTICFDHIDQQPGQAVVPGRLSLILCLWPSPTHSPPFQCLSADYSGPSSDKFGNSCTRDLAFALASTFLYGGGGGDGYRKKVYVSSLQNTNIHPCDTLRRF
jgi:hypothetical protein